jgi:RES domain-containing protein
MLIVWRITTARFGRSAFSGKGARLYGGRWSPKGAPVVYSAANQSLVMLETLVQDQPLRARYVMIEACIPSGVRIDRVSIDDLPSDWREIGARQKLQAIGWNGQENGRQRCSRYRAQSYRAHQTICSIRCIWRLSG